MQLLSLEVKNYRNISSAEFRPSQGINILWGDNAQGKSNFLEIIYLIGTLKSFRGGKNENFIGISEKQAFITASIGSRDVTHSLNLSLFSTTKKILINGKGVRNYKEFFSYLRPVIFSPEEVLVIKGLPSLRRALLDRAIFQSDPVYLEKVRAYDHCLKQRNRALNEKKSSQELAPWTENLSYKGAVLRHARFIYLQRVLPAFRETYRNISNSREVADIHYPAGGEQLEHLQSVLRSELASVQGREMAQGQTLAGPHLDDIEFNLNGRNIKNYGSQGQQRSCMLAFKTAQVDDLEKCTGETPILLLDDLNSELDRARQDFYFNFLKKRAGQAFITTTDPQPFVTQPLENATFFKVVNGRIMAESEMR
jgi:DNA replication and repair protein RecF